MICCRANIDGNTLRVISVRVRQYDAGIIYQDGKQIISRYSIN